MKKLLLGLIVVLGIGILFGYGIGWFFQHEQEQTQHLPTVIEEALPPREVTLYFAEPQGRYLVRVTKEIAGCEDDRDCIHDLLASLIAGPHGEGVRVLPETTQVKGIDIENDLIRIDFSRHLVDHHPGGSMSELLTIYSLINSLTESFPYLRQLQILVESEVRQTLKGHVRIDHPVYADYALTQSPTADKQDAAEGTLNIDQIIEEAARSRN